MRINNLIPSHISDFEAIERIKKADPICLDKDLYEILTYLQDSSWPIYFPLKEALKPFSTILAPHIKKILLEEKTDTMWKKHIMRALMEDDEELCRKLKDVLRYISENPSDYDRMDEVDECAKEMLTKYDL